MSEAHCNTDHGRQLRILAVDISGYFRGHWEIAAGKGVSQAYLATIAGVARERKGFDRVVICCDSGKSFRRAIWPEYKANREDPGAGYRHQLARVLDQLEADGCAILRAPKLPGTGADGEYFAEADDVIGTICRLAEEAGHYVRIFSADKDLLQCVSPTCDRMNFLGVVMGPKEVEEKYGIGPAQIPEWLALAGDGSDNFKPFEGLGEKRAAAIIKAFGSALGAFTPESLEKMHMVTGESVAKKLRAEGARDRAERCLQIATLIRDLDVSFDAVLAEPVFSRTADAPEHDFSDPEPSARESESPQRDEPEAAAVPVEEVFESARRSDAPDRAPTGLWAGIESRARRFIDRLRRPAPTSPTRFDQFALEPQNPKQAWELAKALDVSTLYRQQFPNAEAILAVILRGRALGMGVGQALESSTVVNGRVGWTARQMRVLASASPDCEYFYITETEKDRAVAVCKRRGQPEVRIVSTTQDAIEQGLFVKDGFWDKNPRAMNVAEVERRGARLVFPERVLGMFTVDEILLGAAHAEAA